MGADATTPPAVDPADTSAARATRLLEAMRLGVVPSGDLSAFTVGRDALLRRVDAALSDTGAGIGAVLTVLGDYGTGKTHALELVAHRASEAGYLVASATLGAEETAPSHPARVYRALVRSLRYPGRTAATQEGLRPLFDQAVRSPESVATFRLDAPADPGQDHVYLSTALRYWGAMQADDPQVLARPGRARRRAELDEEERERCADLLLGWIEASHQHRTDDVREELVRALGTRGHLYAMKDYRPWARIYGYVLSGLAKLARTCGYRGLVVLLDEAEFFQVLGSADRDYARTLFKALTWASIGERDDLPFTSDELDLGGQGVQQRLPGRAFDDAPLMTVFAMTPSSDDRADALGGAVPEDSIQELPALDASDYAELGRRVIEVYFGLRPSRVPAEALAAALAGTLQRLRGDGRVQTPRHAMKFILDLLDVLHHRPEDVRRVLTELRDVVTRPVDL